MFFFLGVSYGNSAAKKKMTFINYFMLINRTLKIEIYTNIPSFSCTQRICFPDIDNDDSFQPHLIPFCPLRTAVHFLLI